ncbi:phosphoadenosine phosphosulfate reductase family protein [Butyricicoccus sp. MSJd-7]|uniref:Phosphoadenosine phosphosulfate reductase family protein n=2 Tax=Butyricicoccus intestinisimiae TaxID=2841509 RepID=A0ABS6EPF7_9FIRM|nr:phosphoadenosine phosphosulfate reductase family protein [Butyricicoccus intestinisimiae]
MSQQIYEKPLLLTYSGGKDSDLTVNLAVKAGIPFEIVHSLTTVDMPETVYHTRQVFAKLEEKGFSCKIIKPTYKNAPVTMWTLIPQKSMPPTRFARYCCSVLKETAGKGRFIATGVRRAESAKRASRESFEIIGSRKQYSVLLSDNEVFMQDNTEKRTMFETCRPKAKRTVNPIIDWTDDDVWDYIAAENINVNPKYRDGYKRVGCVGCPLSSKCNRTREFEEYPTYKRAYIRAFDKMLDVRKAKGLATEWKTGEEVFEWWVNR